MAIKVSSSFSVGGGSRPVTRSHVVATVILILLAINGETIKTTGGKRVRVWKRGVACLSLMEWPLCVRTEITDSRTYVGARKRMVPIYRCANQKGVFCLLITLYPLYYIVVQRRGFEPPELTMRRIWARICRRLSIRFTTCFPSRARSLGTRSWFTTDIQSKTNVGVIMVIDEV